MKLNTEDILKQIDQALSEWNALRARAEYDDCSGGGTKQHEIAYVKSRLISTLDRLAPSASPYRRVLSNSLMYELLGALSALRMDYESGYLQSFEELVHADTFANFIEMADHLHDQGYKDAAAVVAGSVLEQHLRELCKKNGIVVEAEGKYKKAETLNAELAGKSIYSKLDQKNVTSWLGLRNDAAHGNYSNYAEQQVRLMIDSIQDFMSRNSA